MSVILADGRCDQCGVAHPLLAIHTRVHSSVFGAGTVVSVAPSKHNGPLYRVDWDHTPPPGTDLFRNQHEIEAIDLRPGFYYVSVQNDTGARRLVRGPWSSHEEALGAVRDVRAHCEKLDPRACWYAFGTARSETDLGPGLLGPAIMGQ